MKATNHATYGQFYVSAVNGKLDIELSLADVFNEMTNATIPYPDVIPGILPDTPPTYAAVLLLNSTSQSAAGAWGAFAHEAILR